jgi:hypothetical protein
MPGRRTAYEEPSATRAFQRPAICTEWRGPPARVVEYPRGVEEPGRSTLQTLRRTILEIIPDEEQVIFYRPFLGEWPDLGEG